MAQEKKNPQLSPFPKCRVGPTLVSSFLRGTEQHKAVRDSIGSGPAAAGVPLQIMFAPHIEPAAQQAGACSSDVSLEI